jgi:hypothetical protein
LVCETAAATPELPVAPVPVAVGQLGALLTPTGLAQAGEIALKYEVTTYEVPDESARCTGWIAAEGSVTPGLSFLIAGSFHFVILPR